MKLYQDKKIILAVPNHFGLPAIFKKNLEFLGFEVFLLPIPERNKLPFRDKIIHFSKKTFLKDKTHKSKILAEQREKTQLDFLENISQNVDFALVIRPDFISENILKLIKCKANYSAAYQWDGMQRFPRVKNLIKYFDRFLVFDENDAEKYPETVHTTNFYFDYLPNDFQIKQDIFFVGTFMKDRIEEIISLSEKFRGMKLKTNINVIYQKEKHISKYRNSNINFLKTGMDFEDSIKNVQSSKIVLDFQNSIHNGLSFRTFEALGFGKKLITNNPLVKNYNFYHPNNIFVIENDNLVGIEDFINSDFVPIPKGIVEGYSFISWVRNTFKT